MSKMKLENISSKARRSPLGCRNFPITLINWGRPILSWRNVQGLSSAQ